MRNGKRRKENTVLDQIGGFEPIRIREEKIWMNLTKGRILIAYRIKKRGASI